MYKNWRTCFLLLTWSCYLFSQDDHNFEEMSLQDLLNVDVTVASKTEESLNDAPSSVTVFSRAEIQNMGVTTLSELLNYVPGFHSGRDVIVGPGTNTSARGFRGAAILFLENGVRLNGAYAGSTEVMNRSFSLDMVKQVEVIRGPGSALYGSSAFVGVVNIVVEDRENEINFRASEHETRQIAANFSKDSGDWNFSAFVNTFSTQGQAYQDIFDPYGLETQTRDPNKGFDAQIRLKYKKLEFVANYKEREFTEFYNFGRVDNLVNEDLTRNNYLKLDYQAFESEKHDLHLSISRVQDKWEGNSVLAPAFPGGPFTNGDFTGGPNVENHTSYISADYRFQINKRNTLSTGLSYNESESDTASTEFNYLPFPPFSYFPSEPFAADSILPGVSQDVLGLYVRNQPRFNDQFNLVLGVRYDDYSDFGDTINPRGAFIYSAPFNAKFKAMYGEAFRAPTFVELYNTNNPINNGNPDLQPEEVATYELAYIQEFNHFQTSLTFFRSEFSEVVDLINPVEGQPGIFVNTGEVEMEGVDFEFVGTLGKHLFFRSAYSQILSGARSDAPKKFGSAIVNVKMQDLNLNFNGFYRGDFEKSPNSGSYWLTQAKLQYEVTQNVTGYVSASNALDEDYLDYSTILPTGIPTRSRMFTLGGTWKL